MKNYLTIDVGGTMIKYGIITEEGNLTKVYETKTDNHLGGENVKNIILSIIEDMTLKNNVLGICMSVAGIVNTRNGQIVDRSPLTNNFGKVNLKDIIEEKFSLPCEIENDANCAGISEAFVGASKNYNSSLCLTVGTGIGGSFVLNKQVLEGHSNCACEIGYIKINGKNFQDIASTSALVFNVSKRLNMPIEEVNGKFIFSKAKAGDKVCEEEIDRICDYLGLGISNICCVLNPEIVVLGGGIMEQWEYLKDRIYNSLKKYLISTIFENTSLTSAQNGNKAGMIGAFYNFKARRI